MSRRRLGIFLVTAAAGFCLAGPLSAQSLDNSGGGNTGNGSTGAGANGETAASDNASATLSVPGAPNSPAIPSPGQMQQGIPSTTSTGMSDVGGFSSGGASAAPISGPGAASTLSGPAAFWTGNGRIPFHITVTVGEAYDDNIFIQPQKTSDEITTLSGKAELRFGNRNAADSNYLDLYYAPTGLLYAEHSVEDTLNHNVDLFYQHRFTRLTLSIDQSYIHAESTNAAIGNLITSDVYNTLATANYDYSDKFSITGAFTQNFTNFENTAYTSSREWDGNFYFLYHVDPRLSIGLGPQFGFLDIQQAPNQTYQQLLAHVTYIYSNKLNFLLDAGGELREYQGGVPGDTATPVFDIAATYQPTPFTFFMLSGARRYSPSYNFIGQDYIATSISLSVTQKFFEKFSFRLGAGYENDSYQFAAAGLSGPTRSDNYFFLSPSLDWHPNDWLTATAYYRYQRDDSTFSAFTFDDNQVGLSLSASY